MLIIGLFVGISASSVMAQSSLFEVSRISSNEVHGTIVVYRLYDNGNTCYISVGANSNSIDCTGESIKNTSSLLPSTINNQENEKQAPSVEKNVCRAEFCRNK